MVLPYELRKHNSGKLLKVVKPLYGLPESPLNWFSTILSHYKSALNVKSTAHDQCILVRKVDSPTVAVDGVVTLQVDDSTNFGTEKFHAEEKRASSRFDNHGAVFLSDTPIQHNGCKVSLKNGAYVLDQSEYIKRLEEIPIGIDDDSAFRKLKSQNALAAYPGTTTRPDLLCHTAQYSQVTRDSFTTRSRKAFNKFVRKTREVGDIPLKFVKLDSSTVSVVAYTDASFSCVW